jgi:hypothetical protein
VIEHEDLGELWPLRLPPLPGELFSSWLVRLARCYEMPIENFCQTVWPGQNVWCGDIDRQIDDAALAFLSRKTGVPLDELFSMTLRAHEQYAGVSPGDECARELYVQLGHTHGIRYCPGCLGGREPYFRLEWRLAFVTVCPRHRMPLFERCDYCSAPCLFSKVDVHRRSDHATTAINISAIRMRSSAKVEISATKRKHSLKRRWRHKLSFTRISSKPCCTSSASRSPFDKRQRSSITD